MQGLWDASAICLDRTSVHAVRCMFNSKVSSYCSQHNTVDTADWRTDGVRIDRTQVAAVKAMDGKRESAI